MTNKFNYTTGLTHTGVFHADDVFSAAFIKILNPAIKIKRVFKVPDVITDDTIVFDIGGGQYDHHQKDAETRDNGIKFAALGLLWRDFGTLLASDTNVTAFDTVFVQSIDDADNGGAVNAMYQAINSFIPNWDEKDQSMDAAFFRAVDFAHDILDREIDRMLAVESANATVQAALDQSDGDIVVLDRFVPWQDVLIPSSAKFVIFPSIRGGFSAQVVPPTIGGRDQKVPFPAEWAGADKEILEGFVHGMTFCHPGRFMVTCDNVEQAVIACEKVIEMEEK